MLLALERVRSRIHHGSHQVFALFATAVSNGQYNFELGHVDVDEQLYEPVAHFEAELKLTLAELAHDGWPGRAHAALTHGPAACVHDLRASVEGREQVPTRAASPCAAEELAGTLCIASVEPAVADELHRAGQGPTGAHQPLEGAQTIEEDSEDGSGALREVELDLRVREFRGLPQSALLLSFCAPETDPAAAATATDTLTSHSASCHGCAPAMALLASAAALDGGTVSRGEGASLFAVRPFELLCAYEDCSEDDEGEGEADEDGGWAVAGDWAGAGMHKAGRFERAPPSPARYGRAGRRAQVLPSWADGCAAASCAELSAICAAIEPALARTACSAAPIAWPGACAAQARARALSGRGVAGLRGRGGGGGVQSRLLGRPQLAAADGCGGGWSHCLLLGLTSCAVLLLAPPDSPGGSCAVLRRFGGLDGVPLAVGWLHWAPAPLAGLGSGQGEGEEAEGAACGGAGAGELVGLPLLEPIACALCAAPGLCGADGSGNGGGVGAAAGGGGDGGGEGCHLFLLRLLADRSPDWLQAGMAGHAEGSPGMRPAICSPTLLDSCAALSRPLLSDWLAPQRTSLLLAARCPPHSPLHRQAQAGAGGSAAGGKAGAAQATGKLLTLAAAARGAHGLAPSATGAHSAGSGRQGEEEGRGARLELQPHTAWVLFSSASAIAAQTPTPHTDAEAQQDETSSAPAAEPAAAQLGSPSSAAPAVGRSAAPPVSRASAERHAGAPQLARLHAALVARVRTGALALRAVDQEREGAEALRRLARALLAGQGAAARAQAACASAEWARCVRLGRLGLAATAQQAEPAHDASGGAGRALVPAPIKPAAGTSSLAQRKRAAAAQTLAAAGTANCALHAAAGSEALPAACRTAHTAMAAEAAANREGARWAESGGQAAQAAEAEETEEGQAVCLRSSGVRWEWQHGLLLLTLNLHAAARQSSRRSGVAARPRLVRVAVGALLRSRLEAAAEAGGAGTCAAAGPGWYGGRPSLAEPASEMPAAWVDEGSECVSASQTVVLRLSEGPQGSEAGGRPRAGSEAACALLVAVRLPPAAHSSALPFSLELIATWSAEEEGGGWEGAAQPHISATAPDGMPLPRPSSGRAEESAGAKGAPPRPRGAWRGGARCLHAVPLCALQLGPSELARAVRAAAECNARFGGREARAAAAASPAPLCAGLPLPAPFCARLDLLIGSAAAQHATAACGGAAHAGGGGDSSSGSAEWALLRALPRVLAQALQLRPRESGDDGGFAAGGASAARVEGGGAGSFACAASEGGGGTLELIGYSAEHGCEVLLTCRPLSGALACSLEARGAQAHECALHALRCTLSPARGVADGLRVRHDPLGDEAWCALRAAHAALAAEVEGAVASLERIEAFLGPLVRASFGRAAAPMPPDGAGAEHGKERWLAIADEHAERAVLAAARSDGCVAGLAQLHDAWCCAASPQLQPWR